MTQILTQNRKKRYGMDAVKEKSALKSPHQRVPNGHKITAKMPFPILLSSRSGVRVPSGVPFLLLRRIIPQRLQVCRSPIGLEPSNATVRWTVARDGSTERLLNVTSPFWRAIFKAFSTTEYGGYSTVG